MSMMLCLLLFELGLLIGSQHLIYFFTALRFGILDNLKDGRFLRIGQIQFSKTRWQPQFMRSRGTSRRRSIVISPRRLQA